MVFERIQPILLVGSFAPKFRTCIVLQFQYLYNNSGSNLGIFLCRKRIRPYSVSTWLLGSLVNTRGYWRTRTFIKHFVSTFTENTFLSFLFACMQRGAGVPFPVKYPSFYDFHKRSGIFVFWCNFYLLLYHRPATLCAPRNRTSPRFADDEPS